MINPLARCHNECFDFWNRSLIGNKILFQPSKKTLQEQLTCIYRTGQRIRIARLVALLRQFRSTRRIQITCLAKERDRIR